MSCAAKGPTSIREIDYNAPPPLLSDAAQAKLKDSLRTFREENNKCYDKFMQCEESAGAKSYCEQLTRPCFIDAQQELINACVQAGYKLK